MLMTPLACRPAAPRANLRDAAPDRPSGPAARRRVPASRTTPEGPILRTCAAVSSTRCAWTVAPSRCRAADVGRAGAACARRVDGL